MKTVVDALIVGGGIAGGAVATLLARGEREVILIERKGSPHDKVCGEFLSCEAVHYLRSLGTDLAALGAVPISAVNVYTSKASAGARLPFVAVSLSRRSLDEAILAEASASGAVLLRGHAVRLLRPVDDQWIAELDDGSCISAKAVFLATGKHDLKAWRRPVGRQNDLIAFKQHWRIGAAQIAALRFYVELFLFDGGYAGLELVENGIANLCLVIRKRRFAELGSRWDWLLSALRAEFLPLHQVLAEAEPCSDRPLAIASIPYGMVQWNSGGLWRLGDQAAVIPSFCGDGIAVALHSAYVAADFYLRGKSAVEFQSYLARSLTGRVRRATLLSQILVRPQGQAAATAVARWTPRVIRSIALNTRIPSRRLVRSNKHKKHDTSIRRIGSSSLAI